MKIILKINHVVGKIETIILAVSILCISLLMICNSIGRSMFHKSIHATEELCLILIMLVTFIGLSNAARNGRHIVMSAIYDRFPIPVRRVWNIILNLVISVFLVILTYQSAKYTLSVYTFGRITTVLAIPMWITTIIIPIGCAIGAVQYFVTFLLSIMNKDVVYAGSEKTEEGGEDQ